METHECYRFLCDEEELRWFYRFGVPPLAQNECYFLSTSCRNKELSEEEREYYQCGRSEMWARQIVSEDDFERIVLAVRRLEARKSAYLTKSGVPYPDKSLVLYWNICPVDAYKAMLDQIQYLLQCQTSLTDAALKHSAGGVEQAFRNIRHCHTTGQSIFARSFGRREWLDIDMDCADYKTDSGLEAAAAIRNYLSGAIGRGHFMLIETAGGIHWLLRREGLSDFARRIKSDPVRAIVDSMTATLKSHGVAFKEIIRNDNEMVALPGTVMYGRHLVTVLNKEDFDGEPRLHKD